MHRMWKHRQITLSGRTTRWDVNCLSQGSFVMDRGCDGHKTPHCFDGTRTKARLEPHSREIKSKEYIEKWINYNYLKRSVKKQGRCEKVGWDLTSTEVVEENMWHQLSSLWMKRKGSLGPTWKTQKHAVCGDDASLTTVKLNNKSIP